MKRLIKHTNNKSNEHNSNAFMDGVLSIFDISDITPIKKKRLSDKFKKNIVRADYSKGLKKDIEALRGDWEKVNIDICKAVDKFEEEQYEVDHSQK